MKTPTKLAAGIAAVVVGGLIAFAAPAVTSVVSDVSSWPVFQPEADRADESAGAQLAANDDVPAPGPEPMRTGDGTHGDCVDLYDPSGNYSLGLNAPIDNGPREHATGEVGLVDGIPTTYTVAPDDAILGIGARFCVFGASLFYFNDVHLQGAIQPGDVLKLRKVAG